LDAGRVRRVRSRGALQTTCAERLHFGAQRVRAVRPADRGGAPPQAYEQYSGADLGAAARAGLARVAGLLLVVFTPVRAEDAFWALVALVEDRLPASCVLKARAWAVTLALACTPRILQATASALSSGGPLLGRCRA